MSGPPRRAMIFAAGRGTRLAPLTDRCPKPLLPVGGRPLIEWQLEALHRAGVQECVINLHHLGDMIEATLGDGSRFGMALHYSREATLLDTGGGLVQALPHFHDEPLLILNGDIYTDFDFATLPDAPPTGTHVHLVLTPTPGHRGGDFDFADGRVTARGDGYVYCGIAVLDPACCKGRHAAPFSLAEILFDEMDQGRLSAQLHRGAWHDIGTPDQYAALR